MKVLCGFTEWHHIADEWKKMFNADTWIMPEQKNVNVDVGFDKYDIIYLYFLNENLTFWIKRIRECSNAKILVSLDSGWWYVLTPWLKIVSLDQKQEILQNLSYADGFLAMNYHFVNFLRKQFPNKKIFYDLFYPRDLPEIQPKSYFERKELGKAVIMFHSMANAKIETQLQVAQRLGLKAVVIGTFQNMNILRHHTRHYGNVELHTRFKDKQDYFNKLNECLIGIEDYYDGGSRFTVECASVGVPVVGTKTAWSLRFFMPELTCEPMDVNCMVEKARDIISSPLRYQIISQRIRRDVHEYTSYEWTKRRLLRFFETVLKNE